MTKDMYPPGYTASVYAYRTHKVAPYSVPFWEDSPSLYVRSLSRPAIWHFDKERGWLLHSRRNLTEAFPSNKLGPGHIPLPTIPPLQPALCSGKWYLVENSAAADLRAVESDMYSIWEAIESEKPISKEELSAAVYLRQVFDHFLSLLAKSARKTEATFANPCRLTNIKERHMKNAIKNHKDKRSYRDGAWVLPTAESSPPHPLVGTPHCHTGISMTVLKRRKRKTGAGGSSSDEGDEYKRRRVSKKRRREIRFNTEGKAVLVGRSNPPASEGRDLEGQGLADDPPVSDNTLSSSPPSSSEDEGEDVVGGLDQNRSSGGRSESPVQQEPEPPSTAKRVQFVTMFDEAVPLLQTMLNEMPVVPEDTKDPEKGKELSAWLTRRDQAVRLLNAMGKAYLSVIAELQAEYEGRASALQENQVNQGDDREQTLADDAFRPETPHVCDNTPDNPPPGNTPVEECAVSFMPPHLSQLINLKIEQVPSTNNAVASTKPSKKKGKGKGKETAPPAVDTPQRRTGDDGFWARYGY